MQRPNEKKHQEEIGNVGCQNVVFGVEYLNYTLTYY